MLTEEASMEIKVLHKQGLSLRDIAKLTGRSVNTIKKYLSGAEVGYKARVVNQAHKLAGYEDYVRARLSAVSPEWIPASVIFREIKAMGYEGKIRQLQYR